MKNANRELKKGLERLREIAHRFIRKLMLHSHYGGKQFDHYHFKTFFQGE